MCLKKDVTTSYGKTGDSYLLIQLLNNIFSLKIKQYVCDIEPYFEIFNKTVLT